MHTKKLANSGALPAMPSRDSMSAPAMMPPRRRTAPPRMAPPRMAPPRAAPSAMPAVDAAMPMRAMKVGGFVENRKMRRC